jgi:hypothetical protein
MSGRNGPPDEADIRKHEGALTRLSPEEAFCERLYESGKRRAELESFIRTDELAQGTARHVLVGQACLNHCWEADETGVRCCMHCGVTDERDRPITVEEQRDSLWALLDNIDTLDDACRENDRAFRNFSRKHLRARFAIHNPEQGRRTMDPNYSMEADIRKHEGLRTQVRDGTAVLLMQARQIWGNDKFNLPDVVVRLMVGVGDLARLTRDVYSGGPSSVDHERWRRELKKELGNVIFSTIRWVDDLGLDVLECLDLAIEAQEKFAGSGRPR